jgi:hypothetical protein
MVVLPWGLLDGRLDDSPSRSGRRGEQKNLLPLSGTEPRFFIPPSCSLITVPTELYVKDEQKHVPSHDMNYVRYMRKAFLYDNCFFLRSTLQPLQAVSRGLRMGSSRIY